MKKSYLPHLHRARQRVADLIGADMGEVVIVPGATHGVNNILREIEWAEGDIILSCGYSLPLSSSSESGGGTNLISDYSQHDIRRSLPDD